MSTLYIGLDDTDVLTSPGTGHLARQLALELAARFSVIGVTRHQLLSDPRVPMTAKNSANVIHVRVDGEISAENQAAFLNGLAGETADFIRAKAHPGGDPGLCLVIRPPTAVLEFGRQTKTNLMTADQARQLAQDHGLILRPLGGDGGGIIGALAAAGLAAGGHDGRFTWIGRVRELQGIQPVEAILTAGVASVRTPTGQIIRDGLVETRNKLRPSLRGGQAVLFVSPTQNGRWQALCYD